MEQLVSLVGASLILAADAGHQLAWVDPRHRVCNRLDLVGAVLLTIVAVRARLPGFVRLEGVCAVLSLPPLLARGARDPAGRGRP